jgi:hypothetical protein
VALEPGSDEPTTAPLAGHEEHPTVEGPEVWGWHADFGKPARIAGWISVLILVVMTTATHYNKAGMAALLFFAALIVVGLLWDINARKNAWRK